MIKADDFPPALKDPLAPLERHLIRTFVAARGEDLATVLARDDDEAHALLANASRYATMQLAQVEARWHYLRELHGQE